MNVHWTVIWPRKAYVSLFIFGGVLKTVPKKIWWRTQNSSSRMDSTLNEWFADWFQLESRALQNNRFSYISILTNCQACLLCIRKTLFSVSRTITLVTRLRSGMQQQKKTAQILHKINFLCSAREFSNFRLRSLLFRQFGAWNSQYGSEATSHKVLFSIN